MNKLLYAAAGVLCVSAVLVQGPFQLKPDKDNVVASRLEGVWILDEMETHRIGGSKDVRGYAFVRDEKIASKIPERHKELLADDLYLCGTVQVGTVTSPFVLTTAHGNPRVIVFHEVAGDAFGRVEAFNVMLCPAMERNKDMLYVGGEKNDRPFACFVRKNLAPEKG